MVENMSILSCNSAIFTNGNYSCAFLLASLNDKSLTCVLLNNLANKFCLCLHKSMMHLDRTETVSEVGANTFVFITSFSHSYH